MNDRCTELVRMLEASVARHHCDAILLSGGLDSSILASILRPKYSVTSAFARDSPDLPFAAKVAEKFCRNHVRADISTDRMLDLVEQTVKIFGTFDPIEIRNSVVAFAGLEQAKADGYNEVMTGDGGDELFAGYNYLSRYYSDPAMLDAEVRRLWNVMHFSSQKIAQHLGQKVRTPFLDPAFMEFAKSLPAEARVGKHQGRIWGKLILRTCYADVLGEELAWRPKLAQEQGAGTDRFHEYISERIDDHTFSNKSAIAKGEGVIIRSKEHLHYYALYRSYFGPPKENDCNLRCPSCHACMEPDRRFCRTCGAFPVTPASSL